VATDDLAYMMALHWFPDHRRRFERHLLDHYHTALIAHGVTGYDRRALDDDYRCRRCGGLRRRCGRRQTISNRGSGGPTWRASSWLSTISAVASSSPCDVATLE
jgi:hypothetical protein